MPWNNISIYEISRLESGEKRGPFDQLGDTACIAGNLPNAMLIGGGPDEVETYCKKLMEDVGRDGGFMLDAGAIIDNAKPENLKAMFNSVNKFGRPWL